MNLIFQLQSLYFKNIQLIYCRNTFCIVNCLEFLINVTRLLEFVARLHMFNGIYACINTSITSILIKNLETIKFHINSTIRCVLSQVLFQTNYRLLRKPFSQSFFV